VRRAATGVRRDNLTLLAAALTYYGVLSAVPGLIVLFAVLGLLGPHTAHQLIHQVQTVAPGSSAHVVRTLITQAQADKRAATVGAVLATLVALWSASSYVWAFRKASNIIYGMGEGRPLWKTLSIRFAVTAVAVLVLVAAAVITVVSGPVAHQVGDWIGVGSTAVLLWGVLKWPVLVLLVSALLAVLYWASPNAKQGGIRWISPGCLIATAGWVVVSALFSLYVVHVSSYDRTYGSLAGVVIFLVWLWLTNVALLFGAEVNAELDRGRAMADGMPGDVEPFVEPRDTRAMDEQDRRAVDEAQASRVGGTTSVD
jgi:membrane protein